MLPPLRIANPIKALKALIRQKKALAAPLPTCISLSTLKPLPGTTKIKQRLGRSRQAGRFCGRGNGGTKSYAGSHFSKLFEGGAVPFHLKVPKYGRKNIMEKPLQEVKLDRIQLLIDSGRLDASKPLTMKHLWDAGVRPIKHGLLVKEAPRDRPGSFYCEGLTLVASKFTPQAIAQIEGLKGTAIALYTTPLSLSSLLKPKLFEKRGHQLPRMAAPTRERDKLYWFSYRNRGYLNPEVQGQVISKRDDLKEVFERAVIVAPRPGLMEKIEKLERQEAEKRFGFDY